METYARYAMNYSDYHKGFTWISLTDTARYEGLSMIQTHKSDDDCLLCLHLIKKIYDAS
jgi:hypothetical protein